MVVQRDKATLIDCQTRLDVLDVANLLDLIEWGDELEAASQEAKT